MSLGGSSAQWALVVQHSAMADVCISVVVQMPCWLLHGAQYTPTWWQQEAKMTTLSYGE